ncbi:MAG TPA: matrixin family metalloprotease [Dehalococcoidia bacterium]|nr:matrixin family metalloprotease [Dehalococcoidia bacterium]
MRRPPSPRPLAFILGVAWLALLLGVDVAPPAAGGPAPSRLAAVRASVDVDGEPAVVTVLLDVAPGEDAAQVARQALPSVDPGARLVDGETTVELPFSMTGVVWDALPVVVNYNDARAPDTGRGGRAARLDALRNAMATWNAVPTSTFEFAYGAATTRCPSLADACPGPKRFDGENDVGWIDLTDRRVLASTTSGLRRDEFDMVVNRRAGRWYAGPLDSAPIGGWYDLETVLLHELGHSLGLDHSATTNSVMYAGYLGVRRALTLDDVFGVTLLYPAPAPQPAPGPAPAPSPAPQPSAPGVPATPAQLIATTSGPGTVRLSWEDRSDNEAEFRIERGPNGGPYALVLRAGPNVTSYAASGVPAGTYVYRVLACNAAGCSGSVSATVVVK